MSTLWVLAAGYLSFGIIFTALVRARIDAEMESGHPSRPVMAAAGAMQRNMVLFIVVCICFWAILLIESFRKKDP